MGGDGIGDVIDTWRRDRLGDEPIYCAVPTPANPDDIICYGSDEELDPAARVAKRLGYEKQARAYLRGQPLRLQSTSLRGPFTKASGWKNPWLGSQPNKIQPANRVSLALVKDTPAVKPSVLRDLKLRPTTGDGTLATGNSIRCHLPSPESNRGLDGFPEYLDSEKHDRIQAWARGVLVEPLEKDDFWAPDHAMDEVESGDAMRKRPAAEDWLRKKPTKRNRPNDSQSTRAASTPTPLLAPRRSMRRTASVFADKTQNDKQQPPQGYTTRSFELTTPSSSAGQRSAKLANTKGSNISIHRGTKEADKLPTVDEATAYSISSRTSTTPRNPLASHPRLRATTHDSPTTSPRASNVHGQEQDPVGPSAQAETSQSVVESKEQIDRGEDANGDVTLESFLDQSFYYRARSHKQEGRSERDPVIRLDDSSQISHNSTPESHRRDPGDMEAPGSSKKGPPAQSGMAVKPDTTVQMKVDASLLKQSRVEDRSSRNGGGRDPSTEESSKEDNTALPGHPKGPSDPVPAVPSPAEVRADHKSPDPPYHTTIDQEGVPEITPAAYAPLKRARMSIEETAAEGLRLLSKKMRLENSRQYQEDGLHNRTEHIGEHRKGPEPAVDEGSTLVGDPMDVMDVEDPSVAERTEPSQQPNSENSAPKVVNKAHSANSTSGSIATDGMLEDGPEAASEQIIVPLSRVEWGITNTKEISPPKVTSNDTSKVAIMEVKEILQAREENVPTALTHLGQSHELQSPWIPVDAQSGQDNIKIEPIEEDEVVAPPSSSMSALHSQGGELQESAIRPSQQSPWAKDATTPAITRVRGHWLEIVMESGPERTTTAHEEQQRLWRGQDTQIATSPNHTNTSRDAPNISHGENPQSVEYQSPTLAKDDLPVDPEPFTPAVHGARTPTPEREISIKSFAKLNTPSPVRRSDLPRTCRLSATQRPGILINGTPVNPWSTKPSNRRVSFAPLPNGDDPVEDYPRNATCHASPPPENTVEAGDEDVNEAFRKHFDAIKRRIDGSDPPKLRFRQRLLPSSSQQRPMSPAVGAMAEAFQQADALITVQQRIPTNDNATEPTGEAAADAAQSPWQSQGLSQTDDVAAVLGNLDQFLDAWDVDTAMKQAGLETAPGNSEDEVKRTSSLEIDALQGVGVWN
ncbi:hypothetical protein DL762_008813 [Monosporascus cannonballus]|uniref:Protamine P1 n=1 Tax=Monosporascus cannonballus TaxID=155416 RepID=A0ABY0GV41_9PEZI|nr:hypothetical protein DL762_008813 [Monosporascus cannonballus]